MGRNVGAPLLGECHADGDTDLVARILSGRGDELGAGLLHGLDGFRRAVNRGQLDVLAGGFDRRQGAHRATVVHAEDALQARVGLDHVFRNGQCLVTLLLAVLRGHDLDAGEFLECILTATNALENRHNRDTVENGDIALAVKGLAHVFAGHHAGVVVLRTNEGVDRALGVGVNRCDDEAGSLCGLHSAFDAGGVGRVEQEDVDLLLDHVFNVADLLGNVVACVGDDDRCANRSGGFFQCLLHGDEVGVVEFLERHTDFQRSCGDRKGNSCTQHQRKNLFHCFHH